MAVHKVLTFRASSIGDCLMGKYFLENVHAVFPEARYAIVVGSRAELIRGLFGEYPWLEVVEANRRSPRSLWRLWRDWRGSDLILTQYAGKAGGRFSLPSKLAARMLAKRGGLAGFTDSAREVNRRLYDTLVPFSPDVAPAELERRALSALALPIQIPYPVLVPPDLGGGSGAHPYMVVHLFAGNRGRGMHPQNKRRMLEALAQAFPSTRLLVTGGKQDREEALAVADGLPAEVVAGNASLGELARLIVNSRLVVSVDTGVAHIAAHFKRPLVVIASCLGLHWWQDAQYGKVPLAVLTHPHTGVHHYRDYPECISEVDPARVVERARALAGSAL